MKPESKYQPEVDRLMKEYKADAVVLVVLNGSKGDGAASTIERRRTLDVATILHGIAADLESGNPDQISRIDIR